MRQNPGRFAAGLLEAFGPAAPSVEAQAAAFRVATVLLLHEASLTRKP